MTVQDFLGSDAARRRYWVGGHLGWRSFGSAEPNAGHRTIAALECAGTSGVVVTQNVDGLHLRAGSSRGVELHGTMRGVVCPHCGQAYDRGAIAAQIDAHNPWIRVPENVILRSDGDVAPETTDGFVLPTCTVYDGMLKPDVVFFGEFVPADHFRAAETLLASCDALVVAGSSLVVNSGVRVIERARRGLPLVVVNLEPTMSDAWDDFTVAGRTGDVLPTLQELLA